MATSHPHDGSGPQQASTGAAATLTVTARAYYRPYTKQLVGVSLLALVLAQLEAAALVAVAPLAKAVADGNERTGGAIGPFEIDMTIDQLTALSVTIVAAAVVVNAIVAIVRSRLIATFDRDERNEVLDTYMHADWPTQVSVRDGRLLQLSGFSGKATMILSSIIALVRASISIAVFLVLAFIVDVGAALAIVVTGALLVTLLRPLAKRVQRLSGEQSAIHLEYAQDVNETSENVRDLLVHGATGRRLDVLHERSASLAERKRKIALLSGLIGPAYQYVGLLLVLLAVWWASKGAGVELAALGVIALLLVRSISYARQMEAGYRGIIENLPYLERLEEARTAYRTNALPIGGATLESVHELQLDAVTYSYDDDGPALHDVDLTLRPGEILGVVGPSGSGKSTLLQVLLRLREPQDGTVRVNGLPASDYSLASWYDQITMVPQHTHLFHDTVANNIGLRGDADRDAVVAAATAAGIHDVIAELADGYDTEIGPAFRDLSGGQVQRIGIARALLRGASVIVLDEPTSALDVHSEAQIQESLQALGGSVTLVIIAHRMSTLSICDRLAVFNEGRVEAIGTLHEVFETSEFFRSALDTGTLDLQGTTAGE